MTREEVREIAKSEADRLVKLLPTIDPVVQSEVYRRTIDNIQSLNWLVPPEAPVCNIGEPIRVTAADIHPVDSVSPFPEPSTEEYTAPVMETTKPEKTYTKEDVRAALAKSRDNGVDATEFLNNLGYKHFSAVPASAYPEIMAKLEEL